MTAATTIRALLDAGTSAPAFRRDRHAQPCRGHGEHVDDHVQRRGGASSAGRIAARCAWVEQTAAAWRQAMREMTDRCSEAVETMSEEEFERLCAAEEAKVMAIRAKLDAVIERDAWPRALHWGNV